MADAHGSPAAAPQVPAAGGAGPAPVPYAGADQSAGVITYAATGVSFSLPGSTEVLNGIPAANAVQESGYAHDVNAGLVTPYYPGTVSAIGVHGDNDPGGRDDVAGDIAGAVAAAEARYLEYQGDAIQAGPSTIGDQIDMPVAQEDANAPASGFLFAEGDQPGKGYPAGTS
jgi:hypothetical protein